MLNISYAIAILTVGVLFKFYYDTSFNWQVAKLSLQTGFISEYTSMIMLENDLLKKTKESPGAKEVSINLSVVTGKLIVYLWISYFVV